MIPPFKFTVQDLGTSRYLVRIETRDRVGFLSLFTGLLTSYDLNIQNGEVTSGQGQISDAFEVFAANPVIDWESFKQDLEKLIENLNAGKSPQARFFIHEKIFRYLRAKNISFQGGKLTSVDIHVNQTESPAETVVTIEAQDTPAFLYALSHALALLEINIVRMNIQTAEGRVQDKLWLTHEGEKILSEKKLKALKWAILLLKQLTYLLPKVPDPKAALEQLTLIGKDLFEREDFAELMMILEQSRTMENLSKILGTSRFLWEEFMRTQYQAILPLLGKEEILSVRKEKPEMREELSSKLAAAGSFREKEEVLNQYKDMEMFRIDARHILGQAPYVGEFTEEFTDLAEVAAEAALSLAVSEVIKQYRFPKEPSQAALFALGKFGGRELGYASDLEVLLVYRETEDTQSEKSFEHLQFYSDVVRQFKKLIHAKTEGVFEIDLRLRPYGEGSPLAVSKDAFTNYYGEKGGSWDFERQSLIKLRAIAGDPDLAAEIETFRDGYVFGQQPFDYAKALMLRVRQQKELSEPMRFNVKYSAGGLLDIEYLVQTLQITYGRNAFGDIRHPNTLKALRALWQMNVIAEKEFQDLRAVYVFLRGVINALRIVRGNAKDLTIPREETDEYVVLARRMGFYGDDYQIRQQFKLNLAYFKDQASRFYEQGMQKLIRQGWPEVFPETAPVQPMLRLSLDDLLKGELSSAALEILRQIGFEEIPETLLRFRRLCPPSHTFEYFAKVLDWAWEFWPEVGQPDLALKHLEWLSESIPNPDLFWQSLAQSKERVQGLLQLFGTSRYLSEILIQHPKHLHWIYQRESLLPGQAETMLKELRDQPLGLEKLQILRHQETLRLGLSDLLGRHPPEEIYRAYSDLADFVLDRVFQLCFQNKRCAVLAVGKLGGCELNFSSDLDLLFTAEPAEPTEEIIRSIQKMITLLKEGNPQEFLYRTDLRLRPHGEAGQLFLTPEAYGAYYETNAAAWERQMLIKLRPAAGDADLGKAFARRLEDFVWIRPWTKEDKQNILSVKKMYEDKIFQEGGAERNIKMGPGGIRDIEFTVQWLQLKYGTQFPGLRSANTLEGLKQIEKLELLPEKKCHILREGYLFLRQIENRLHLYQNRQTFDLPEEKGLLRGLAVSLGFRRGEKEDPEIQFGIKMQDFRRECRKIFEEVSQIFCGKEQKQ